MVMMIDVSTCQFVECMEVTDSTHCRITLRIYVRIGFCFNCITLALLL